MNRLWTMGTVALIASAAAACVQGDETKGKVVIGWTVAGMAPPAACPAGSTVQVLVGEIQQNAPCAAGESEFSGLLNGSELAVVAKLITADGEGAPSTSTVFLNKPVVEQTLDLALPVATCAMAGGDCATTDDCCPAMGLTCGEDMKCAVAMACAAEGEACQTTGDCCTGGDPPLECGAETKKCEAPAMACGAVGTACTVGDDCCTGQCTGEALLTCACANLNQPCVSNADCCTEGHECTFNGEGSFCVPPGP